MQLCASTLLCVLICICARLIDQCSLQASQSNISGAAHVYSAPEKRLLSAPVTLHVLIHTWIQFRIGADRHTCTHAHKEPLLNSHTYTRLRPPSSGLVEGHVFVSRCQDAGVCSGASRSIRFIFFSRGCLFVCGPVSFRLTPVSPPRGRQCVCNTTDTPALCITMPPPPPPPPWSMLQTQHLRLQ